MKIGVIGQGTIGKAYADKFDRDGHTTVRFSLEPEFAGNAAEIAGCPVVVVAVPTPQHGPECDLSHVESALKRCAKGSTVVIKSTLPVGTTARLQTRFPELTVLHCPEFLPEAELAAGKTLDSGRTLIGVGSNTTQDWEPAEMVKRLFSGGKPSEPPWICHAETAELAKQAANGLLYVKAVFGHMIQELADHSGADYPLIAQTICRDPRLGNGHLKPLPAQQRGVAGHCLLKDFEALIESFRQSGDKSGAEALAGFREKNLENLSANGKDADVVNAVFHVT